MDMMEEVSRGVIACYLFGEGGHKRLSRLHNGGGKHNET